VNNWTVVTVTFNSRTALLTHWEQPPTGVRWVVVDNNSSDDTPEVAKSLGAEVVRLAANIGFSAANNRGLALATSEYVAFANPDVTIDWGTLDQLASDIESQGALIAPILQNPDGSPQPNARGLPYLVDKFAHRGVRFPGQRLDMYTPEMDFPRAQCGGLGDGGRSVWVPTYFQRARWLGRGFLHLLRRPRDRTSSVGARSASSGGRQGELAPRVGSRYEKS